MDKGAMKEPAASTPVWDELEEWTRGRIQEWMQQLLVEEVTEFLGRRKYQRRGAEMAGYRNGYGKPRRLTMRSGTVTVRRPRVRDLDDTIREPTVAAVHAAHPGGERSAAGSVSAWLGERRLRVGTARVAGRAGAAVGEHGGTNERTLAGGIQRVAAATHRRRDRVPVAGRRVPESGSGEGEGGVVGGHRSETGRPQGGAGGDQRLPRVDGAVEQPAARSEGVGDE